MIDVEGMLGGTDPKSKRALYVLTALAAAEGAPMDGSAPASLEAGESLDALALAAAILIEAVPEIRTPQQVRHAADDFAREIRENVKALREIADEHGMSMLDLISAWSMAGVAGGEA